MNKIVVLTNNVILIGNVHENNIGMIIDKPHSIQRTADGFQLIPFLENFTGQEWKEVTIQNKDILTSTEAENNEVLQAYLKKISGIITEDNKIIL